MNESLTINKEVLFNASQDQVWDLLTNPAMTQQYMFGCEVLSDWELGSQILWKGKTEDGQDIIYVQGEILSIEPGTSVSFTMFDPNLGLADIPANYASLTYTLAASDEGTVLSLLQGYDEGAENAQKRYEESLKGWDMVIPMMQKLVDG